MTNFYANYVALCAKEKKSLSAVAESIGLSRTAPNGWKKGKQPSDVTLEKLSQFFGVPVSELTGVDTERLTLDEAKRKLSIMVDENPSMPSGDRLDFLFDETDYEPMIVAYNLDIDQTYIDSWINHGILPPQPIVDKILGVFQMKVGELLNGKELAAYEEENEEWGKVPSDSQNKKAPTLVSESGQPVNVVKMAGRDGSFIEKHLNDKEFKLLTSYVELLPDADDL